MSGQKDQQRTIEEKQEEKEECPDMQVQVDLLAQDLCLSSDDEEVPVDLLAQDLCLSSDDEDWDSIDKAITISYDHIPLRIMERDYVANGLE